MRDYARYRDDIQCAAAELVAAVRAEARRHNAEVGLNVSAHLTVHGHASVGGPAAYYALHVRRGDFQFREAKIGAAEIVTNLNRPGEAEHPLIPPGALVYVATDDPDGTCARCMWDRKACDTYPTPRPKKYGCPDDPSWAAFARDAGWKPVFLGDFIAASDMCSFYMLLQWGVGGGRSHQRMSRLPPRHALM